MCFQPSIAKHNKKTTFKKDDLKVFHYILCHQAQVIENRVQKKDEVHKIGKDCRVLYI